uniref:Uncharacterized protein n=1 Tax=Glossina pallidipes TaxID=7398 RepID=A0A1A9ZI14_GLOPL
MLEKCSRTLRTSRVKDINSRRVKYDSQTTGAQAVEPPLEELGIGCRMLLQQHLTTRRNTVRRHTFAFVFMKLLILPMISLTVDLSLQMLLCCGECNEKAATRHITRIQRFTAKQRKVSRQTIFLYHDRILLLITLVKDMKKKPLSLNTFALR